jgi:hypothetical protein
MALSTDIQLRHPSMVHRDAHVKSGPNPPIAYWKVKIRKPSGEAINVYYVGWFNRLRQFLSPEKVWAHSRGAIREAHKIARDHNVVVYVQGAGPDGIFPVTIVEPK